MKVVLLGPPGAGKGTQAPALSAAWGIPHISTGDMLRMAVAKGDAIGVFVKKIMEEGRLVSDETMFTILQERLKDPDCSKGFILDGFPRTTVQAEDLDKVGIKIDFIIVVTVPDEELVKRVAGRRIHLTSGRVYNIYTHPPKVDGHDDVTGEKLVHRKDDNEETVRTRLHTYHAETEPLIDWYRKRQNGLKLIEVDGTRDEKQVREEILSRVNAQPRL